MAPPGNEIMTLDDRAASRISQGLAEVTPPQGPQTVELCGFGSFSRELTSDSRKR
jgi:hypothetical protein